MISDTRPVVKVNRRLTLGKSCMSWEEQCHELLTAVFGECEIVGLEPCTGGITNRLFKATLSTGNLVLIRVYGRHTENIIDRRAELENMVMLGERGLAGQLYGQFENGFVYSFLPGRPLQSEGLGDNSELIAEEMARWHSITQHSVVVASVFTTTRSWLTRVTDRLEPSKVEYYNHHIDRLSRKYSNGPIVFCHNDLLAANIIRTGGDSVKFIDYEYAAFNIAWFDLANHFCEYAGFECDWSRLPDSIMMRSFVRHYQECLNDDHQVTVEEAVQAITEFMPMAHLFWGLWALLQASLSDIDFDYEGYGRKRLARAKFVE